MRSLHLVLVACIASTLFACTDPAGPRGDYPAGPINGRVSRQLVPPVALRTLDDEFVDLTTDIPGFAGYFVNDAGELVIALTDVRQETRARQVLGARVSRVQGRTRVRKAEYDFATLKQWKDIAQQTISRGDVTFVDADEMRNRVRVGVARSASMDGVRSALLQLGVPSAAIIVDVVPPKNVYRTLQDSLRPFYGGSRITVSVSFGVGGTCTFGYTVAFTGDTAKYGVTNSHCGTWGSDTNEQYTQPIAFPWAGIGEEHLDPPYTTTLPGCPSGEACRYSDAALFRYTLPVTWGYMWETLFAGTTGNGSITIDEDHPLFTIIDDDENLNFAMGANLSKMGQASGWTSGNINATCATEPQWDNGAPTGRTLLCQYSVYARSVQGDSGSPVFSYFISSVDPSVRWAFPHGILWGADGFGTYAFSPISSIRAELGAFVTGF